MKKIISLFHRNYDGDRLVRDDIVAGAEWVIAGEGVATRKFDGTCCMVRNGALFRRYDAKAFTVNKETGERHEYNRAMPENFEAAQEPDPETGHWPGWIPVGNGPSDRWHHEALRNCRPIPDGTYELVGPMVQGNPEHYDRHELVRHGSVIIDGFPRTYAGIKMALFEVDMEGVVWHRPNGDMVKIKARDFGIKRGHQQ
jgi:hypothetical protein